MTTDQRNILIGNLHTSAKGENTSHKWTMYIKDDCKNAAPLEKVVYHLHPTFKPQDVCITAKEDPAFQLERTGWGSFAIVVELLWADGKSGMVSHELDFESSDYSNTHVFNFMKKEKPKPKQATTREPAKTEGGTSATTTTTANDDDDDEGMGEQQMSDPDPKPAEPTPAPKMTEQELVLWHGYLLAGHAPALPPAKCIVDSNEFSRPDYTKIKSAEFLDSPEVLDAKADVLISMWTQATHPLIYAGAGISTSSGIRDYASNAKGSAVQPTQRRLTMDFIHSLRPTPAHRIITAMEKKGYVWGWLQQNHDGLAQKAGFPGDKVNELHGAWLNQQDNPIIKMSGTLRSDLFEWCLAMEEKCDFVLAVGTSFSGLNSDRCAATCAKRHMKKKAGQGLAIISIQSTPYDDVAGLRVFSRIDDFMLIVAKKMGLLPLDTKVYPYVAPKKPVGPPTEKDWDEEVKKKRGGKK